MELTTIKNLTADVAKENIRQRLMAKQGDMGTRFLKIAITKNGELFPISEGTGALLNVRRPDREERSYLCAVEEDGSVLAPLSGWSLFLAGTLECDVSLSVSEGEKLTTSKFFVEVEEASCAEENLTEEEDYSIILSLIAAVENAENDRAQAEQSRNANEEVRQAKESLRSQAENARLEAELEREETAEALLSRLEAAAENYEAGLAHTHVSSDIVDLEVPTALSDLSEDAYHRTVSDAEKAAWNKNGGVSAGGLLEAIYPIGSIYMSVNNVSPAFLLGGEWVSIQNRFLFAASSEYAAGTTGGEEQHILTISEVPEHQHTSTPLGYYAYGGFEATSIFAKDAGAGYRTNLGNVLTGKAGGNVAHNNMPPYLAVYMWKRVS